MADPEDLMRDAMEQARRAREEADRLRREARDLGRRLRHEERGRARQERGERPGPPPGGPGPHFHFGWEAGDGLRAEQSLTFEGVREVHINQQAGRVTVRPCAEGETPGVVATASKSAPTLEVHRDNGRLRIEVKLLKGWLLRRKQGATTTVRVGEGFAKLGIDLGYGELQVRDIACETIKLDVGAGDIQTYSTSGFLEADLGAGKIAVHDHIGLARCDTGTGDVLMDIAAVVDGEYRINVGMGRAELRLPPGAAVHVRAASGIGRARVEVPNGPDDAPTRVNIETGIGEVVVRARDEQKEPARPPAAAKPQRGSGRAAPGRSREVEQFRVLQLLEQGRISSQEAAELIAALQGAAPPPPDAVGETSAGDEPTDDTPPPAGPPVPYP
ncbi:MAG: SHOCT-like domain-containing protein [Tepidiformaceae bacterium]